MGIFKSCDIRGRFGTELLVTHADQLGRAIAQLIGPSRILVGGDGRMSTPVLRDALISSLVVGGCQVIDLGTVPTPAFYFARKFVGVKPGIMVTASHNPADYNGFKIILGDMPIREEDISHIQTLMELPPAPARQPAGGATPLDVLWAYRESVRALAPNLEGLRVVVDCSNGMAALVAEDIWRTTGADVEFINNEVDGTFPHHLPNPANANNLRQLAERVTAAGADLGIAYDGDSDRVGFVDEAGNPASPDKTIAILAAAALEASGPASIVFDQKCSRLVAETIMRHGGTPLSERSGHTFIKAAFIAHGAPYAGELSGHHFFGAIQGDDGIYASLVFCEIIKNKGKSVSALLDEMPSYPITPDLRVPMTPAEIDSALAKLEEHFKGRGLVSTGDGVRIDVADGWGLARRSVTEPVMTLRFEGVNELALRHLIESFIEVAPELAGKLSI
jgi:phosphomannomutase / phosphoglucomutase